MPALAGSGTGAAGSAVYGASGAQHPGGGEPGRPFDEGFWDARTEEPPAPIPVNAVAAGEAGRSADAGAAGGAETGTAGAAEANGHGAAEALEGHAAQEEPRN